MRGKWEVKESAAKCTSPGGTQSQLARGAEGGYKPGVLSSYGRVQNGLIWAYLIGPHLTQQVGIGCVEGRRNQIQHHQAHLLNVLGFRLQSPPIHPMLS